MRAVDMSVLAMKNGTDEVDDVEVRLQRHPYPPFVEDPVILILQSDFTFIILISFIVTAPNICKDIVLEKERKLRVRTDVFGNGGELGQVYSYKRYCINVISL